MTIKTAFRWHLWLGLITGVFMFLIGVSGAIAVFIEEIDWLVTPALRAHAAADQPRANADVVLASVRAAYPDARIVALNLASSPAFAHVAKAQTNTRGNLDIFIDPVTARITGDRQTSAAYTSTLRNFIRQFHVRLLMGLWGRVFVGVFGVTLVLSCITGLWIYRGWFKNLFRLRWRAAGPRTRWSDLHKFVGVWSLVFNLIIGVTGAVLGIENLAGQIRSHWLRPRADLPAQSQQSHVAAAAAGDPSVRTPLGVDALLARAREEFPDLAVRTVLFPANPIAPVVLRGDVPSPFVMQSHVRRANFIAFDPYSGAVHQRVDGREAKGWGRIYSTFDPLHFGYFGGMTTKIIWFVLGLAPGVLALTGFWLWWRRRRAGPAPAMRASFVWCVSLGVALVTLAGAYVLVARAQGTWTITGRLIEHALAKPVSIALVVFPVTGLLGWLTWRSATHRARFVVTSSLCGAWYLTLVSLFQ